MIWGSGIPELGSHQLKKRLMQEGDQTSLEEWKRTMLKKAAAKSPTIQVRALSGNRIEQMHILGFD